MKRTIKLASISPLGVLSSYNIPSAGNYYLEFGVHNWIDTAFDAGMAIRRRHRRRSSRSRGSGLVILAAAAAEN